LKLLDVFLLTCADDASSPPLVPDAHLAAYAIENGATLHTHDRDVLRFQRLRVEFPLSY